MNIEYIDYRFRASATTRRGFMISRKHDPQPVGFGPGQREKGGCLIRINAHNV
jgi:hypothetical protein